MKINLSTVSAIQEIEKQAKENQKKAYAVAMNYRKELETRFGIPIQLGELKDRSAGGTVRPLWNQRTPVKFHTIALKPCAPWLWPHKLAHELVHIELEAAAHAAGKRMTHIGGPLVHCHLEFRTPGDASVLERLFSFSCNVPVDMLVEAMLRTRFPELSAAQFVNVSRLAELDKNSGTTNASPQLRHALESLVAARALFTDRVLRGGTSFFARFQGSGVGTTAEKLNAEFEAMMPSTTPGAHYELVTRFAEILGLPGLHAWDPRPTYELCRVHTEKPAKVAPHNESPVHQPIVLTPHLGSKNELQNGTKPKFEIPPITFGF